MKDNKEKNMSKNLKERMIMWIKRLFTSRKSDAKML